MTITINNQAVKIIFVDESDRYAGWFNSHKDEIRVVETTKDVEAVVRHELTHAYLYYYGFSGAELSEELMCNFVEIYGPAIITTAQMIYNKFTAKQERLAELGAHNAQE